MSDGGETIATEDESPATSEEGAPAKRLKFPTALTVLALVLLVVWVASFFIPSGVYDLDPEDRRAGSGHVPRAAALRRRRPRASRASTSRCRTVQACCGAAPPNGLYGIENATTARSAPTR